MFTLIRFSSPCTVPPSLPATWLRPTSVAPQPPSPQRAGMARHSIYIGIPTPATDTNYEMSGESVLKKSVFKNAKTGLFGEFFKNLKLAVKQFSGEVTFKRTKIE